MSMSASELAMSPNTAVAPTHLDALLRADAETLDRLYAGARTPKWPI